VPVEVTEIVVLSLWLSKNAAHVDCLKEKIGMTLILRIIEQKEEREKTKVFAKKIQRRRFFLSSFTTKMFNLSKRNERLAL
jgi:hypothetical protein